MIAGEDVQLRLAERTPQVETGLRRHLCVARADEHRLGLLVRPDGQVTGKDGAATRGLFALGPLCQGTLFEITAVPEIVRQADAAALSSVNSLATPGSGGGETVLARARG